MKQTSVEFSLAADQQQLVLGNLVFAWCASLSHDASQQRKSLDFSISEMLYNSPSAVWLDHPLKLEQIAWPKGGHDMRTQLKQCNQSVARTANGALCNRYAGRRSS
jgi:hypothetical protein